MGVPEYLGIRITKKKLHGVGSIQKSSLLAKIELLKGETPYLTIYGDNDDFDGGDDDDDSDDDDNFNRKCPEQPEIWITGVRITAGRPYWPNKSENYNARNHVLTSEEINKGLLLLPDLPTPHVSEYRLSQVTPSDPDNDRLTEGHREDCSWP